MTIDQLKSRSAFHEATASMYERMSQPTMAKQFRQLAAKYQQELETRTAQEEQT